MCGEYSNRNFIFFSVLSILSYFSWLLIFNITLAIYTFICANNDNSNTLNLADIFGF